MSRRKDEVCLKKCSKHDCPNDESFEERKEVYNTKQATVEVTVKLKRQKTNTSRVPDSQPPFRKGSWGDLLSQNKAVDFKTGEKYSCTKSHKGRQSECTFPQVCHNSKSNCQKIPVTEELYLETHTHVTPNMDRKPRNRLPSAKYTLIKENEILRKEIDDLRKEVDKIKSRKKVEKVEKNTKVEELIKRPEPEQENFNHSVKQSAPLATKDNTKKKIAETQTDGRLSLSSKDKELQHLQQPVPIVLDRSLEMENAALRREAEQLLEEMRKAKHDQNEYITTIKDLYQLAELLKNENQLLVGTHEEKQKMQERLIEALSENQALKQHLDALMIKRSEGEIVPDEKVTRIRSVIRDVKSTIAHEIQGIEKLRNSSMGTQRDASKAFNFQVEDISALLNDTHSSEIQRILNPKEPPLASIPFSEDRSSTQYYGIPANSSPKGSRYRPSPVHNEAGFSPKVSTPVDVASNHESADLKYGTGDYRSSSSREKKISPGDIQLRSDQDLYRMESCQSFLPLPLEAINDDSNSTTDYRSTTSSRSSLNRYPLN